MAKKKKTARFRRLQRIVIRERQSRLSDELLQQELAEENWESLDDQREIKFTRDKKIAVIGPKGFKETVVPLFCPLCVFPMRTKEDSLAYHKRGVCEHCDMRWGSSRRIARKNGPELIKKTKDWEDYIETRLKLNRPLINLK